MSKLDKLQRLDLLNLPVGREATPTVVAKLDEDESPLDWPDALKRRWADAFLAVDWNRHPPGHLDLQRAIAEPLGLEPDWVSLGAGADDMLRNVLTAWCLRGTLVYPVPTNPTYGRLAQTLGIKHVAVLLKADFTLPVEQVVATANNQEASVVLVGNPNNPTGNLFARDEILAIARDTGALVVVDETHIEYSGVSLADAIPEVENLAVLRAFSHAAAFRVGYLLAHPRVTAEIEKIRLPHNVGGTALLAAQVLLSSDDWPPSRADLVRERETLRQALSAVQGVVTWPSAANFLLVGTTLDGRDLAERLLDKGVAVQAFDRSPLMNCVRVTVGTPAMNAIFVDAMTALFGADPPAVGFKTSGR
ncbi:MAG: hisC [Cyanobacteria bacterium RYN_339]|nr:hisC [Cyanobacteria bacterium RYN_339]